MEKCIQARLKNNKTRLLFAYFSPDTFTCNALQPLFRAKTVPIRNQEEAPAYALTPALKLRAAIVTAASSCQFYEAVSSRLARLQALIAQNDPFFVARLV